MPACLLRYATLATGALLLAAPASAACINTANSVGATGGSTCTVAGGAYAPTVGWTTFMSAGGYAAGSYGGTLNVSGDATIVLTPQSTYNPFATAGIGASEVTTSGPATGTPSLINAQNITLDMRAGPANVSKTGMGASSAGIIRAKDYSVDILVNNQSNSFFNFPSFGLYSYTLYNYGILAGNTVDAGAGSTASQAHAFSYVYLDNATIRMDTSPSSSVGAQLNISAGIRAIKVQGTSGYVQIANMLDIETTGQYSPGVYISGGDSQVHVKDSRIVTAGTLSNALKLGKVRDLGTGSARFYSTGVMNFDTTAAPDTPAILMLGDRTILDASAAGSSGAVNSAAMAIQFGNQDISARTQSDGAVAQFNNTSFSTTSTTASLFRVDAGQTNATLSLRGAASASIAPVDGWLLEVQDASAWRNWAASATFNVSEGAQVTGLTTRGAAASDLYVNLDAGARWTLAPRAGAVETRFNQLQLTGGAVLEAGGDGSGPAGFIATGDVLNASGVVNLGNGRASDVLTINGNYTGGAGSLLNLDVALHADPSATDLLHVTGATAGTSNVRVGNAGGAGAPTVEGIRIIQVDGASDGVFSLLGDYSLLGQPAVIAGAYAYTLHKNGVSTPDDGHWYLRSTLTPTPPEPPEPPTPPDNNPPGPTPPAPTPIPPTPTPIYQPGAPLYETMPRVALGLMGLPTLQQRVGNRFWHDGALAGSGAGQEGGAAAGATETRGFWGRFDGQISRAASGHSTTSARVDQRQWRAETGLDFLAFSGPAGTLVGGVNLHYGQVFADIASPFGRGRNHTTGYGLGATATWYGANGFYADAQGRLAWLDTDLTSHTLGRKMADGVKGFGHALSLELGQRLRLSQHLTLVPQAQLTWSGVRYDRFIDPYGAGVSTGDAQSLQGRLGLALQHERQWLDASGAAKRASFYGVVNLHHEFLDGLTVNVSGARLRNDEARTWASVGLGGSYNINGDAFSLYGEILTATNLSGRGDSYRLGGKLGMRVKW